MKSHCVELRRARPLLGTIVDIQTRAPNDFTAMRAIEDAFDAVERVHRLMSFHDPASDVSRLNREAHQHSVKVDDWTWTVLLSAHEFADESNGAFDITVGRLLTSWNLLPRLNARHPSRTTKRAITCEVPRSARDDEAGILRTTPSSDRQLFRDEESFRDAGIFHRAASAGG
jgi:thiamine biosynthesis lipoprotein ApbE